MPRMITLTIAIRMNFLAEIMLRSWQISSNTSMEAYCKERSESSSGWLC